MLKPLGIKSIDASIFEIPEGRYSLSFESLQFSRSAGHPISFAERSLLLMRFVTLSAPCLFLGIIKLILVSFE